MDLYTKAKNLGIQTEFLDGQGHRHVTDAEALKIILDALPVRKPYRFLEQAVVVRSGRPARTELSHAATFPLRWKIVAGLKVIAEGATHDRLIIWPADLPVGSYRLHLTDASSFTEEAPLIVAPPTAFDGDFDRCWLLAVQLYGVRSARNWGIGDFTDLAGLIELAGLLGADGVAHRRPALPHSATPPGQPPLLPETGAHRRQQRLLRRQAGRGRSVGRSNTSGASASLRRQ